MNGKDAAFIVNTITERIAPWHKVKWLSISPDDWEVEVEISGVFFNASTEGDGVWLDPEKDLDTQGMNLTRHLNGILSGKVRNDAGELVNP